MGYPSDLTDEQWEKIEILFKYKDSRGKHMQIHEKRQLINAVLYINKTGCQWRMLPNDLPKYATVSSFYHRAIRSGLWNKVLSLLVQETRQEAGRDAEPSYALIDSQSAKTTGASEKRGYDGGKKLKVARNT